MEVKDSVIHELCPTKGFIKVKDISKWDIYKGTLANNI